jgi:hypothetical protein
LLRGEVPSLAPVKSKIIDCIYVPMRACISGLLMNQVHLPPLWIKSFQSVAAGNDLVEPESPDPFSISCTRRDEGVSYTIERLASAPIPFSIPTEANQLFEGIYKTIFYTEGHTCPFLLDTGTNYNVNSMGGTARCSVGVWTDKIIYMYMEVSINKFDELHVSCNTLPHRRAMLNATKIAKPLFEDIWESYERCAIVVKNNGLNDCPVQGTQVYPDAILKTLESSLGFSYEDLLTSSAMCAHCNKTIII